MSVPTMELPQKVARRKPDKMAADEAPEPRDRIDLRVDADFWLRIHAMAERYGLSMTAYIKLAVTERLERDEASVPRRK